MAAGARDLADGGLQRRRDRALVSSLPIPHVSLSSSSLLLATLAMALKSDACICDGMLCFFPCSNVWCVLDYLHVVNRFQFRPWIATLKLFLGKRKEINSQRLSLLFQ
jgi:hypothetical protein